MLEQVEELTFVDWHVLASLCLFKCHRRPQYVCIHERENRISWNALLLVIPETGT